MVQRLGTSGQYFLGPALEMTSSRIALESIFVADDQVISGKK